MFFLLFVQFLQLSETPYANAQPEPAEEPQPAEEPEVNASASLNDWLVFPSSQELEVWCCNIILFLLLYCIVFATLSIIVCYCSILAY